jgi:dihydroorotate dehydrogenase electron transfer subunit
VKTFTFKDRECATAKPGQFLMFWIPGVDEIPLSILDVKKGGDVSVAVKKVGEATEALHKMEAGDVIGVRGPFGNTFTMVNGRTLMIGGGTGIAPLLFLAKKLASQAPRMIFVLGAKTKSELLFMDDFKKIPGKGKKHVVASTEDGSCGITGMCTDPLEKILEKEKPDMIYACGPELMIAKVFELAEKHGTRLEVSLERLMRCAIGLCGSCVISKYRVCTDGTIFTKEQLIEVRSEFGVSKRDFDGRKIQL